MTKIPKYPLTLNTKSKIYNIEMLLKKKQTKKQKK